MSTAGTGRGKAVARKAPGRSTGSRTGKAAKPFWRRLSLAEMSPDQWESLCDGCGRCCLNKLEDWDTGEIAWTSVACSLLDGETCRCTDYENRTRRIPDCQALAPEAVPQLHWLPSTCAYRLVAAGRDLYWWHPLVSGDPDTVHAAGISVRGRTISESEIPVEALEDYLVRWPDENPMDEPSSVVPSKGRGDP